MAHGSRKGFAMKRVVPATLAFLLLTGFGFNPTKMVGSLTGNPLIASLMSGLGLNANQAVGGAGALLGLAQTHMPKADWSKLASAIPGTGDLIKTAKSLGGISKFTNLAGLSGAFTKMGLAPDAVGQLTPAMGDYVSKAAGPDLGNKFKDAIK
jgi:hypothetical protein